MHRLVTNSPSGIVFWFRQDLRLHDQTALSQALARAHRLNTWILPIYIHAECQHTQTVWGFQRTGPHRQAWGRMALQGLDEQLQKLGSSLLQLEGDPVALLSDLVQRLGHPAVICEDIAAPEEQAQVQALGQHGVVVEAIWQSTLFSAESLPFTPHEVPDVFTAFRQALERHKAVAAAPVPTVQKMPPLPPHVWQEAGQGTAPPTLWPSKSWYPDRVAAASFPLHHPNFHGGELAALAHLEQYCHRGLPHTYKSTRNDLQGLDFSSKWSPWLATGALSARTAWAAIREFELIHGATESSYWLGFELLWRDHFRWLHQKYGKRLYRAQGLSTRAHTSHDSAAFSRWCRGETGEAFIDAGMRELAATGYMSNRMRQNVASYLVHDLACDWRAGAAWFERCLIDYDVYSNQGNWLYLSGRGTDPRGGRRFNPALQASRYDADGLYRSRWLSQKTGSHGTV